MPEIAGIPFWNAISIPRVIVARSTTLFMAVIIDANEMGILLVAAGHFETENISIKPLADRISKEFKAECVIAKQNTPIITI